MEVLLFLGILISLGGSILGDGLDKIFIAYFMDEDSSGVPLSIYCNFCFLGFLALAPTDLSRFKRGIDLFATILAFFFFRDFNYRWSICS